MDFACLYFSALILVRRRLYHFYRTDFLDVIKVRKREDLYILSIIFYHLLVLLLVMNLLALQP